MSDRHSIRCAIYTRKSSEEGLEQSFNSLDAQREACQSYVLSQRQEGWRALETHYDDGGFSGGSMDRPALKRLLVDIDAKKVDTVVVYKVDRLTRSLADFAKIIEAFDARGVSFVSVTQQFNTTSSMGRLTLNVLLSFAQFEREVTGERIRDKIAASKQKGMWMGGVVPLGYDVQNHCLIVNEKEAQRVRQIYALYLEHGCVKRLKLKLDELGVRSKIRVSPSGNKTGGLPFHRGALYRILENRIYLGETTHKGKSFQGQHEAIIDQVLWDRVRTLMKENVHARRHGSNAAESSLLRGLVYDMDGVRYTPSHAVKNGKRYRYYISQRAIDDAASGHSAPSRIPARELEKAVLGGLNRFFTTADELVSEVGAKTDDLAVTRALIASGSAFGANLAPLSPVRLSDLLVKLVKQIVLDEESVRIIIRKANARALLGQSPLASDPRIEGQIQEDLIVVETTALLKRGTRGLRLIVPSKSSSIEPEAVSAPLLKAICRGQKWMEWLVSGKYRSQREIGQALGIERRYVDKLIPCAFLAPEIVEDIVNGKQPASLTLSALLKEVSLSWREQIRNFAI